jgi:hypothetical protein
MDEIVDENRTVEYKYIRRVPDNLVPKTRYLLPIYLFIFQVIFIVLYAVFATYEEYQASKMNEFHLQYSSWFFFLIIFSKKFYCSNFLIPKLIKLIIKNRFLEYSNNDICWLWFFGFFL